MKNEKLKDEENEFRKRFDGLTFTGDSKEDEKILDLLVKGWWMIKEQENEE